MLLPSLQKRSSQRRLAYARSTTPGLTYFQTEIEKRAYAQGAVDGEQAAQAMEAGAAPEIPGTEGRWYVRRGRSPGIQEMIQSGEISPEEAEALLASTAQDGEVTLDEVVAYLEQAVASGEVSQEEAAALLQAITQGGAGEAAAPEAAAAEAPVSLKLQKV